MDTEIGCFIKPEVGHAEKEVQLRFKIETTSCVGGASKRRPGQENALRKWVKELGSDPVQVFAGDGH
jgi:transposase